jgi:hypothetical protein
MPESPKADFHRYLQAAREALLWKLDGLSECDVRHNAGVGAAGTNDAIDYGPGAHQIMDEEEQRTVHVGGQWCCRGVAGDDVNVVPPVLGHAGTGVRRHGLAQIDARDVAARTDSCYEVGKVRPGTTANVEHVVAGPQPEAADHARAELARPSLCTRSARGRPAAAPVSTTAQGAAKVRAGCCRGHVAQPVCRSVIPRSD